MRRLLATAAIACSTAFLTPARPPVHTPLLATREPLEVTDSLEFTGEEMAEMMAMPSYEARRRGGSSGGDGEPAPLAESACEHIRVLDDFLPAKTAQQARDVFVGKFSNPRDGKPERFVWDYWYVKGQYTLLRTPAEEYLGPKVFAAIESELCRFGRESLGCAAISPPWLSLYVDGCEQRMHADGWHGPWAFVLSLTDYDRRGFEGGETLLLKPHTLDYWRSYPAGIGLEEGHLVDCIEPHFNRLSLFDGRVPHGVRQVRGTQDPLRGRLVLHGWFTEPAPFFSGGLSEAEAAPTLDAALAEALPGLERAGRVTGSLAVRITVAGDGAVTGVTALTDTLVEDPAEAASSGGGDGAAREELLVALDEALRAASFPPSRSNEETRITVPFLFE